MEEKNIAGTPVETAPQEAGEEIVETAPTSTEVEKKESTTTEAKSETFTQEEVNAIVKERLAREQNSFYKKHSVKDEEELKSLLDKASKYDDLDNDLITIKSENSKLKEQNAFVLNDIDPSRYDDIRAYFKGKELDFSNEALKTELETHPEWLLTHPERKDAGTTIKTLGVDTSTKTPESEDDKIKRLFGI